MTAMKSKSKSIDWEEVKGRIKLNEAGLERSLLADPARIEKDYHRRAVALAARRNATTPTSSTISVLVFLLGTERYGLELGALSEVLTCGQITPVPTAPSELIGVINVRGEIRTVVDLGRILGLSIQEPSSAGYIVLMRDVRLAVGLRVDALEKVVRISPEILITGDTCGLASSPWIRGMTAERLIILNAGEILSHQIFKD